MTKDTKNHVSFLGQKVGRMLCPYEVKMRLDLPVPLSNSRRMPNNEKKHIFDKRSNLW